LFKSYLPDNYQFVAVNEEMSYRWQRTLWRTTRLSTRTAAIHSVHATIRRYHLETWN